MLDVQLLENIIKNLPSEDPSVIEIKRILAIKEPITRGRDLAVWFKQYKQEAAAKPFLSLLAHTLVLQLGLNDPQARSFIKALIQSSQNRWTKSGFTGSPDSPENQLHMQLARLCVDWDHNDAQEQFWKILYPEIISVYDGKDNTQWPPYGQAILVKNAKGEMQSRLINYAEIYKLSQTQAGFEQLKKEFSSDTLRRIYRFYPGHKEFWINAQNNTMPQAPYENYLDFFKDLQKFLKDNMYHYDRPNLSDPITNEVVTEDEISPAAQGKFYREYRPFLMGFLNHVNTDGNRKTMDAALKQGDARLFDIVEALINPPLTGAATCFNKNQQYLKRILENSEVNILKKMLIRPEIHFDKNLTQMGVDNLSSVSTPGVAKVAKDKNELLALMHEPHGQHNIQPSISYWAAEYKRIMGDEAFHARILHDFLYEVHDSRERVALLHELLGNPLDFSLLFPDSIDDYLEYSNKIIAQNPLLHETDKKIESRINMGMKKAFANGRMTPPLGFLSQIEDNELLNSAFSHERSESLCKMFNDYIDSEQSLAWDYNLIFLLSRKLDLAQARQLTLFYQKSLQKKFLHDHHFFTFFRSFYVKDENREDKSSPSQDMLFELIVRPALGSYCKNSDALILLGTFMEPYRKEIIQALESKIPTFVNSIQDTQQLLKICPEKINLIYERVKLKMSEMVKRWEDLEELEKLFPSMPVRVDFIQAVSEGNNPIHFRPFCWLFSNNRKTMRDNVIAILHNTQATGPREFIMYEWDSIPVMHEFRWLSLNLNLDEFKSLIAYYGDGIRKFINDSSTEEVLNFTAYIGEKAWPTFYEYFKKEIQAILSENFMAPSHFKEDEDTGINPMGDQLNKKHARKYEIFKPILPNVIAHITDRDDLVTLQQAFPIDPTTGIDYLSAHLTPLTTMALAIYKLLPEGNKEEYENVFDNFDKDPILKQAWKIAVIPDETKRREAACRAVFGNIPIESPSATTRTLRLSEDTSSADASNQTKLEAIRIATTLR